MGEFQSPASRFFTALSESFSDVTTIGHKRAGVNRKIGVCCHGCHGTFMTNRKAAGCISGYI